MSAPDANGWFDIETAPKDGTEIILYGPPVVHEGKWYPHRVTSGQWCEWSDTEECEGGSSWASWDGGFLEENPPTLWQPLPSPPITYSSELSPSQALTKPAGSQPSQPAGTPSKGAA